MTGSRTPAPELADLEPLYDAHHRQAIGLAYRMLGDLGDAEEVVQEVFLSAWRSGHTYDPSRGSTHTWILSMVRNRSIDLLRARRRRPVQPLVEGVDVPDTADVTSQAVSNVDAQSAYEALKALPPEQKQELILFLATRLRRSGVKLPPPRKFSKEQVATWIAEDEAEMKQFQKGG